MSFPISTANSLDPIHARMKTFAYQAATQLRDGAGFGTRTAKEIEIPRPQS
jgi:hypothetical protein